MAKQKFERNKEHLNIGTIGHVDHGKTTFSAALTHVSSKLGYGAAVPFDAIDNAPEEKQRGITIKASTIEFNTEKRHYSLTDCPGHADYVKNMITGASQADALILIIAGTDGVKEQTTDHILLAKQINVKHLIIFINKIDVADPDLALLAEEEARELAEKYGFVDTPVLSGSALGALEGKEEYEKGIKAVMDVLDEIPLAAREMDKPFRMYVDGVIVKQGRGTVATGKIAKGVVKLGDQIDIISKKKGVFKTTVTGIEMFRKELDQGQAGDNVGLLLRGVSKEEISRGDVLALPGSIQPHDHFQAEVYILTPEEGGRPKPFKAGFSPQFYFGTADVTGPIGSVFAKEDGQLAKKEIVMPGDNVVIDVTLLSKLAIEEGIKFAIRESNKTIGAGVVTKIIK